MSNPISGHTLGRDKLELEAVRVFKPIVLTYIMFVIVYYAIITVFHIIEEVGVELIAYVALSVASSLGSIPLWFALRKRQSKRRLELGCVIANVVVLTNILLIYVFSFDQARLVYFLLATFVFAMTGSTARVSVISSALAVGSMFGVLAYYNSPMLSDYVYVGFGACFMSLGTSMALRLIIRSALKAKIEASEEREEAQVAADIAQKLAITDALTGLPNRRAFFDKLDARAATGASHGHILALLLVDLDGFKPVNDTYGHQVGDDLLKAVGERVREALPDDADMARIGGDEFAVLLQVPNREEASELGAHICRTMRRPFNLGRVIVHVGATVGAAACDGIHTTPGNLAECADYAMYHAKRTAKGTSALFTGEDADLMRHLFRIDQALRGADLEEELEVYYQPQLHMPTNTVTGFEALARWHSDELGQVDPQTFIQVAETSALITGVTQVLLRKALADLKNWPEHLELSFNLSVHDILDAVAIKNIIATVKEAGIAPERICFEITETVMMGDVDKARRALQTLVDAGHRVALDDFGTGYSNFSYLHDLPLHSIKLDRSLLRDVSKSTRSVQMIMTLLQFTRSLNKDCVIEGIETAEEFTALQGLGAQTVQGFFCGRPMPASDVFDLVTDASVETKSDDQLTG